MSDTEDKREKVAPTTRKADREKAAHQPSKSDKAEPAQTKKVPTAAEKIKNEVDSYKIRLTKKLEEVKKFLLQKLPADTEKLITQASELHRALRSRLDSFGEILNRFQAKGDTDSETDIMYQADATANIAI